VHVYRLIAKDTIEEKILDLQEKKAQLMEAVSSENQTSLLEMSKEDLLALL
jgi:SNF2 family DNA or RNA helicase